MNARELILDLKSKLDIKSDIEECEIKVDIIGTSNEAKANIYMPIEGKISIFEVTARRVGIFE